jgi:hypothetical protein
MCFFRNLQEEFQIIYSEENNWLYFNNICGVMDVVVQEHKASQCRLFIHVRLHSGNKFPFVPLAYATNMKETYENSVRKNQSDK